MCLLVAVLSQYSLNHQLRESQHLRETQRDAHVDIPIVFVTLVIYDSAHDRPIDTFF